MGNAIFAMVSKKGKNKLQAPDKALFDIPVTGLKGEQYARFGELMEGYKMAIIVNVATK